MSTTERAAQADRQLPRATLPVARSPVLVAAAVVVAAGLGARYGLTGWWAKYLGVALWDTLVYVLVLLVRPGWSMGRCVAGAVAIGWAVEFAQLTALPAWLSGQHIVLRWMFGIGFSPRDLPAYVAGALVGVAIHAILRGHRRRAAQGAG